VEALAAGARDIGFPSVSQGMFTNGAVDLIHHFMRTANVATSVKLDGMDLAAMTVNERIAAGVRVRLELLAPFVRSWPQAVALGALPQHAPQTLLLLAELADELWWHAGDRSTDLNWYSRRLLLLAVYTSTELYMLTDASAGHAETWAFLDRRLAEATTVGQRAGEALAVASAAGGGAAAIAGAAFEFIRPAAVASGAAVAATVSAVQSAAAGAATAAGLPGASLSGAQAIAAAAAPAVAAAAAAADAMATRLQITLPPALRAAFGALAMQAAPSAASERGGISSAGVSFSPNATAAAAAVASTAAPPIEHTVATVAAAAGLRVAQPSSQPLA